MLHPLVLNRYNSKSRSRQSAEPSALMLSEVLPVIALLALFPTSYLPYFEAPYFVGWGTLALINAGLAQGKHKSGLLWFVISIFLGPLATLILVLLPKG